MYIIKTVSDVTRFQKENAVSEALQHIFFAKYKQFIKPLEVIWK